MSGLPAILAASVVGLFLMCGCGPADKVTPAVPTNRPATERTPAAVKSLDEKEKIEALIKHVEGQEGVVFVRNDKEYDAATAAKFLRGKWERAPDVKTARAFIDKIASDSSTSGKPYLIRLKDGTEVKSRDYLSRELEKMEQGER